MLYMLKQKGLPYESKCDCGCGKVMTVGAPVVLCGSRSFNGIITKQCADSKGLRY
jgi:hypothetical protein